ncbi:LSM1 protein [Blastocladiella britannica]|nr:LSM1 protein [Blastocladiella britannica]
MYIGRVLSVLRDGRTLIGLLRSYDQFGNLVLQDTVERIAAGDCYSDIDRGIFIVRGENLVMVGVLDGDAEDALPLREVPVDDALNMQRMYLDSRLARERVENSVLHAIGFSTDAPQDDTY